MAYVVGSARIASAATSATASDTGFVLSSGSNRKVLVSILQEDSGDNGVTHSGVTFNAVAMTQCGSTLDVTAAGSRRRMSVWRIDEASLPVAGTYTVTGTVSGAVAALAIITAEFTGRASGAPSDQESHAPGSATVTTNEITPTGTDDIAVFGMNSNDSINATPDTSDYTAVERIDATFQSNACGYLSTADAITAGTYTAGITWASAGIIGQIAVSLSPAAATTNQPKVSAYHLQQMKRR